MTIRGEESSARGFDADIRADEEAKSRSQRHHIRDRRLCPVGRPVRAPAGRPRASTRRRVYLNGAPRITAFIRGYKQSGNGESNGATCSVFEEFSRSRRVVGYEA